MTEAIPPRRPQTLRDPEALARAAGPVRENLMRPALRALRALEPRLARPAGRPAGWSPKSPAPLPLLSPTPSCRLRLARDVR